MSGEILGILITAIGGVVISLITAVFSFLGQRAARRARDEITNNHEMNIRDELTAFIKRVIAWQDASDRHTDSVDRRIDSAAQRMDQFSDSLNILRGFLGRTDERVLEHARTLKGITGPTTE